MLTKLESWKDQNAQLVRRWAVVVADKYYTLDIFSNYVVNSKPLIFFIFGQQLIIHDQAIDIPISIFSFFVHLSQSD